MARKSALPIDDPCLDPPSLKALSLEYRDIAWWAETADGLRDQELVVSRHVEDGETRYELEAKQAAASKNHEVVIDGIRVNSCRPNRPRVTNVMIEVGGKLRPCTVEGQVCDAVFCSESAIRKFLLPYYHSQRLLNREQWDKLHAAFNDETVPAMGHVAPSHPGPVGTQADNTFRIAKASITPGGEFLDFEWLKLSDYP